MYSASGKMAAAGTTTLTTLFADLHRFGQNQDYERAIKVADKILAEDPEETKAFHCKIVCLLHLGDFDPALKLIVKRGDLASELSFEKAYCEYRLNRTEDALKTLNNVAEPDHRIKELLAQVYYRLEKYEECFALYKDLIKNSQDDLDEERQTNLSAVMAALQASEKKDLENPGLPEVTYELCYNAACFLIGKGLYKEAEEKLRKAEALCRESMADDPDITEEELQDELAVIQVQLGYTLQLQGRNEEAMKLYNQVVKQKPSDAGLTAAACNNIVSLNKDQNVFDSKKKMKTATSAGVQPKLTSYQKEVIDMNQCLLFMYTNQGDQCCRSAKTLQEKYPEKGMPSLILAAQHMKDRKVQKAIDVLQDYVNSRPNDSITAKFSLAQLQLSAGHVHAACDVLRSLGELSHKPGLVSALVTLYTSQEDTESASAVLNEAIAWHKKNKPNSPVLTTLIRANANYQLKHGNPKLASQMLEELRKSNPHDTKALAQLIAAYSQFDPQKAQEISRSLPSAAEMAEQVDVDALENSINVLGPKYIKKGTKVESPRPGTTEELIKKKKHKKKKTKLPKEYDPNVDPDPERWIARRERSYYKGKRKDKRKDIGKGTQGASSSTEIAESSKLTGAETSAPSPTPSPAPQGPRQQKPQGANKKKKKKGNKW